VNYKIKENLKKVAQTTIKLPQQADSIVNEGDRLTDIDTTSLSHNETHQPIVINIQNQNTNQNVNQNVNGYGFYVKVHHMLNPVNWFLAGMTGGIIVLYWWLSPKHRIVFP
jgi:hypothetical protein